MFFYKLIEVFFVISVFGYVLSVIKEKRYLNKNMIILDNKHVTQEDLDEIEVSEFVLYGSKIRTGDQIKLITMEKKSLNGVIIGAKKSEKAIYLITRKNEIVECKIQNISGIKIISKYGSFF